MTEEEARAYDLAEAETEAQLEAIERQTDISQAEANKIINETDPGVTDALLEGLRSATNTALSTQRILLWGGAALLLTWGYFSYVRPQLKKRR